MSQLIVTKIRDEKDIRRGLLALSKLDVRLARLAQIAGPVPLRAAEPGFAGLAGIIVSQQVSRASATAIHQRLLQHVDPLSPQSVLASSDEVFRAVGLSRPKQATLRACARAVVDDGLDLEQLCHLAPGDARDRLIAIHGIGPWTAEVYLMFCAGHSDIFPAGDVALQEAARAGLDLKVRPGARELEAIAQQWRPWRSVAARLLWAYYRTLKGGRDAMAAPIGPAPKE